MQAILDACSDGRLLCEARVVVGNNSKSGALIRARDAGIACYHLSGHTHPDPGALDAAICDALQQHEVQVICLAGYMKLLGPRTLASFRGHILNIHPGLLPRHGGQGFYGLRVHEAVLAAGETESGATVHIVTPELDGGPIVSQATVAVEDGDTSASLAAKILVEEHRIYPEAIGVVLAGGWRIEGRRFLRS